MKKKAFITRVTGQESSFLVEFLLNKDYEVHGIKRRRSSLNTQRVEDLYQYTHDHNPQFLMHYRDLTDSTNLIIIIKEIIDSDKEEVRKDSLLKNQVFK